MGEGNMVPTEVALTSESAISKEQVTTWARHNLESARSLTEDRWHEAHMCLRDISNIKQQIAEGVLTLEDIVTTDEELRELERNAAMIRGEHLLESARNVIPQEFSTARDALNAFRKEVAEGVYTMGDFKTSAEELAQYEKNITIARGKNYLEQARGDASTFSITAARELRNGLKKGDYTHEDINTTEDEVKSLVRNADINSVNLSYDILLKGGDREAAEIMIGIIREGIANGNYAYNDLKFTEEDLERLGQRFGITE